MTAIVACALRQVALTLTGGLRVWALVPLAVAGFIGHGVVRPNAAQGALEPMPEIAGVASAVLSATQMVVGAGASAVVAALFDGRTALAMTLPMAACAVASALVYARIVRPAERRWLATHSVTRDPDPIVEAEPVS